MTIQEFAALHVSGDPLILFNIWDAGSAKAVAEAGAKAIATGSAAVAGAQGYDDGEEMPFADLITTTQQIASAIDLPLSVDMESGYSDTIEGLAANASALHEAGAAGCNLEDRLIGGEGLRAANEQAERIAAVHGAGLFVNARTDIFLGPLMAGKDPNRTELVDQAIERAAAYAKAGAGSFFVPGLSDPVLIEQLVGAAEIPVNVMRLEGMLSNAELGKLGIARISYGPGPWRAAMAGIGEAAIQAFAG